MPNQTLFCLTHQTRHYAGAHHPEDPTLNCRYEDGPTLFDQPRDGATYDDGRDRIRLGKQHLRVYRALAGGYWLTLADLSEWTGDPEGSISARLRDFRKPRFGGHTVERRHVEGGLWEYRLIWNPDVPRPTVG